METDLIVRDDGSAPGEAGESTDEASESGEPRADDETVVGRRRIESVRPEAMQLVTALVGDPNPLHFDGRYVAEQGLDGRVNQGPVNTSYVAQAASANLASPTDLRSLSVQFDGFVTEGQTVEALARPASETSAGDGRTLALELLADGRTVLTGSATVTD